jgi:hypothetical protein
MAPVVERLLAVGRWRWTPFLGLTVGSATLVVGLSTLVPDRIGSVLAPPPQRSNLQLTVTGPDASESGSHDGGQVESTPTSSDPAPYRPPQPSRTERRRGFSPVVREEQPEMPSPVSDEQPALAEIDADAPEDPEERQRWLEGQNAARLAAARTATRAATRAARRASAVAGRLTGPRSRSAEEPEQNEEGFAVAAEPLPVEEN